MDIQVRNGKEEDLPGLLGLIRELAHFEKAPEEVEVTLEEMRQWGFGKEKLFGFFVLEKKGKLVGAAVYYYKYSTWKGKCIFLEDIIITESERRRGYGKLLFNEVAALAKKEGVRRMEWQVLDWNKGAIAFYEGYEALFDHSWINCKLTYAHIQSL